MKRKFYLMDSMQGENFGRTHNKGKQEFQKIVEIT